MVYYTASAVRRPSAEMVLIMAFFLTLVGFVLIIEGLPYFAFPEKMKALLSRIPFMQTGTLRVFGLAAIVGGLVLIYFSRRLL